MQEPAVPEIALISGRDFYAVQKIAIRPVSRRWRVAALVVALDDAATKTHDADADLARLTGLDIDQCQSG